MGKILGIIAGMIIFMALLTWSLSLISEPNTFYNIIGVFILSISLVISTEICKFINKIKKNEKN